MPDRAAGRDRPDARRPLPGRRPHGDTSGVLDDVDASLAALLTRQLPDGTTVSFEAPSAAWVDSPPGKQVVNAFLYDIREEPNGRAADWDTVRDERGRVIGRQPPPRRYEMSYLVTAWAGDAALEHRLLSEVLRLAFVGEAVPTDCRVGSLAENGRPVLRVVRQDPPHSPSQVWSDLGLPPRLVVDVAVTATLVPPLDTILAPPAEGMHLGIGRGGPGGFRPAGPKGPQRPDQSGMPAAAPDQHWRSRMVDEKEEAGTPGGADTGHVGPGSGDAAGAGAGAGEAGPGEAGTGRGGDAADRAAQLRLRRRVTTKKKD